MRISIFKATSFNLFHISKTCLSIDSSLLSNLETFVNFPLTDGGIFSSRYFLTVITSSLNMQIKLYKSDFSSPFKLLKPLLLI